MSDTQAELRKAMRDAIKAPLRSQISTSDFAVNPMSSTKLSEVMHDLEEIVTAHTNKQIEAVLDRLELANDDIDKLVVAIGVERKRLRGES